MKTFINTTNLAYDDHGIGQPILFLHAFPLNRSMWEGEITALLQEERYRLVALDWRGFGESDVSTDVSTMEMFADDVAALMDTLGMQNAILCGLSMGGYAAFAFLRKYPQRVKGLILADTRPGADTAEARANRENVARLAETQGAEAIADLQIPKLISEYTHQHHLEVEMRLRKKGYSAEMIAAVLERLRQRGYVAPCDILPSLPLIIRRVSASIPLGSIWLFESGGRK